MPADKAAENALGTIGTICWTIQLVRQLWKSYREKSTEGLSQFLVFIWGASGVLLGVYAIVQNINIPIIVQPQLFGTLSFLSFAQVRPLQVKLLRIIRPDELQHQGWLFCVHLTIQYTSTHRVFELLIPSSIQCQYYGSKRPFWTCVAIYVVCLALLCVLQVGFVYAVRPSYEHGHSAGVEFFGIASSVTIAVGLLPQYYEIWKHGEVIGISIPFMTVDMLGGVFNDLSLAFKSDFNVIASVTYSLVVVMDGIVILLALILNPLVRRRRKRAALAAMEVDTAPMDASGDAWRTGDVELAGAETRPDPSSNAHDADEKQEAAYVDEERRDMTVTTSNAKRDTPQHS